MSISKQLAKHLRDVHFGGNWCTVDLKSVLSDVTFDQAQIQVYSLNSIFSLTFHMTYYLDVLIQVLEETILGGKDELSWISEAPKSKEEWENFQKNTWEKAEKVALLIEQLPDEKLTEDFVDPKYGTNYRNIAGIVEHTHYHLGQITIIKKLLLQ
ncbi:MAG: DUF1572 domain-containing protein [Fluviicola sp.]